MVKISRFSPLVSPTCGALLATQPGPLPNKVDHPCLMSINEHIQNDTNKIIKRLIWGSEFWLTRGPKFWLTPGTTFNFESISNYSHSKKVKAKLKEKIKKSFAKW